MVGRVDDGWSSSSCSTPFVGLPCPPCSAWPASIIPDCCLLFSSSSSLIVSASHAAERARQYKPSTRTLSREGKRKGCGLLRGDTFGAAPRRALGASFTPIQSHPMQTKYTPGTVATGQGWTSIRGAMIQSHSFPARFQPGLGLSARARNRRRRNVPGQKWELPGVRGDFRAAVVCGEAPLFSSGPQKKQKLGRFSRAPKIGRT